MERIVININTKSYLIEKVNDKYLYNSKEYSFDDVDEFVTKLIKMCRANERRNKYSSNNKIVIYYSGEEIVLLGIDSQVIKYIKSFLD